MADKSDLQKVLRGIDTSRANAVYGLSDGHIYIDSDASFIQKIASIQNLEIFTFKGTEIEKITNQKVEKDGTTGS